MLVEIATPESPEVQFDIIEWANANDMDPRHFSTPVFVNIDKGIIYANQILTRTEGEDFPVAVTVTDLNAMLKDDGDLPFRISTGDPDLTLVKVSVQLPLLLEPAPSILAGGSVDA